MDENFCLRLARLREARKWSQHELAVNSDLKLKKVAKLESDCRRVPSWADIKKLANALGTEPLYLATGDNYHFPTKRSRYYPAENQSRSASANS